MFGEVQGVLPRLLKSFIRMIFIAMVELVNDGLLTFVITSTDDSNMLPGLVVWKCAVRVEAIADGGSRLKVGIVGAGDVGTLSPPAGRPQLGDWLLDQGDALVAALVGAG